MKSEPVFTIDDIDTTRIEKLIEECAEEVSLHDFLLKVHTPPGSTAALGRSVLSAGFSSEVLARAEELVSIFYRSLLKREPDPQGLRNHVDSIARGATLESVLTRFIRSAEFVNWMRDPLAIELAGDSVSSVKGLEKETSA